MIIEDMGVEPQREGAEYKSGGLHKERCKELWQLGKEAVN